MLDALEEAKRPSDERGRVRAAQLLRELERRRFTDAASLIRLHEILLFMCAYPQSAALLARVEKLLKTFAARVERLRDADPADFYLLADPQFSGIAGTSFSAVFGYDITRWLDARFAARVEVDWEGYENESQLVAALQAFLPLFKEGAYVEVPVPFLEWMRAAEARGVRDLAWLLRRFESLPLAGRERAALFDSCRLWVRWQLKDDASTRTRMRLPRRKIFYHDEPLLGRKQVSLAREFESPPLPVEKLSRAEGERFLDTARTAMALRFRELHGFTYGDARHVYRADAGRGLSIYVWGVTPEHRLPSLAYHSVLISKNGVPAGYAEGLTLFERVEIGLNLYYTFRDGESAWIYARLLRLFRQLLGASVFSVDPYQLGFHNEEGIASGAFWFYRKLGFRPVQLKLARLVEAEERKLIARPGHRTSPATLRRLASGHMLLQLPSQTPRSDWDDFHIRQLGLRIQRRMAQGFDGDAERMRRASDTLVARALDLSPGELSDAARRAFSNLSPLLALIPNLSRWPQDERRALAQIIRAKAGAEETGYLRLLQRHARLRREIIRLGS